MTDKRICTFVEKLLNTKMINIVPNITTIT